MKKHYLESGKVESNLHKHNDEFYKGFQEVIDKHDPDADKERRRAYFSNLYHGITGMATYKTGTSEWLAFNALAVSSIEDLKSYGFDDKAICSDLEALAKKFIA